MTDLLPALFILGIAIGVSCTALTVTYGAGLFVLVVIGVLWRPVRRSGTAGQP